MNDDIQISNEELLDENEILLAYRKELISQIDSLKIEKENLIAVLFSMEVLLTYAELEKPPRPFNLM
jgi:hypothetical protein